MSLWRRLRCWAAGGPAISRRQFFGWYLILFALTTILLALTATLERENHERITEIRQALVVSCRRANEVRDEMRHTIQDLKNTPVGEDTHGSAIGSRWLRLTIAQSHLVDKRCLPP